MTLRGFRLPPGVLRLAAAHLVVDGYGNLFAPLLPLLVARLDLSLATAGVLAMGFQLASAVAQLGFGPLADRWRARWLVVAGPLIAVVALSLIGRAGSAVVLGVILMVGGLGSAAFHPPAAALVHRLGGDRPGLAMSIYISGGTLGFSLVPLLAAPVVERAGLEWSPLLAAPGLLWLAAVLPWVPSFEVAGPAGAGGFRSLRPYAKPLGRLFGIVVLRTVTALAFSTFLPVMLTRRGLSVSQAAVALATYLLASGLGGFLGGPAADRYGPRRVVIWSLVLCGPFLAVAPRLDGWPLVAALGAGGFFLLSTLPVNVTYGQLVAPVSASTVSSLLMGAAWGTAGLAIPLAGRLADGIGVDATLSLLALLPLAGAVLARGLPPVARPRAVVRIVGATDVREPEAVFEDVVR